MTRLVPSPPESRALARAGQMPQTLETGGDGKASIDDLWRILWCRRGLILAMTAVVFLATLAYGLLAPPIYTASSEILVDPRDRQVLTNDVNPSGVSPDGGITQVESQARVIGSSGVLLRAIAATNLIADADFNGRGRFAQIRAWFMGASGTPEDLQTATLRTLRRQLSIKRADRVLVIEVVVTAPRPETAASLANAIADAYLADQADSKEDAARKASAALTDRLAGQRARVESAENAIQAYRAAQNIVTAGGQLVGEQQLADLSSQLIAARSRASALKAQVDQIGRLSAAGLPADATSEAIQSGVVAKLREQEGALIQRQADLEARLGPKHPSIIAVRSELVDLRKLIAAELNRTSVAARADYERAQANVQSLAAAVDRLKADTLSVGQASVRLRELERDLEASRSVYATFLARAQETRDQARIDSTNARIITRALPPHEKSWPPLPLLLAGALVSGLGLGGGAALFREYAAPTVLSRAQIERALGARVIGILPPRRTGPWPFGGRSASAAPTARELSIAGLALRRLFDVDPIPRDPATIRNVLVISGVAEADARRRLCGFLGSAAVTRGDRVLQVDADFSEREAEEAPGLLDVLHGECALDAVVAVPPRNPIERMGRGRDPAKPSNRTVTTKMLHDARHHFDLAVIDGGVAAENLAVAPLVFAADEVVLVVQLMRTTQKTVIAAADAAAIMGQAITAIMLIDPRTRA